MGGVWLVPGEQHDRGGGPLSGVLAALHDLAPWAAGLAAGFAAYRALSAIHLEPLSLRRATARRLDRFAGAESWRSSRVEAPPSLADRLGDHLLLRLNLDPRGWALRLAWAQLDGHFLGWTVGGLVGRAALLALAGVLWAALIAAGVYWLTVPALFALPFLRVRSRAEQVRRQVLRALPETAALVAAEMAAGNPPDQALARAIQLPGILGRLLARAMAESRASGRPLFSRSEEVRGTLVDSLRAMRLPPLLAFASQVDLAARKGAAGAELMQDIARGLAREHRLRVMRAAEQLESDLVVPTTLFFFLPFVAAVMIPLLLPLLAAF